MTMADAFWISRPGAGEIRSEFLAVPGPGEVGVRTLRSGISRGTETVVFGGRVPESEYQRMRAPFQVGEFPGPVKYGYLNVGEVEEGPAELLGRRVFCLYPHQTRYVVPVSAVTVIPDAVPSDRAVLAGTVETAVNALWDAGPLLGDRVTVVGAGMIGCAVARLAGQIPATTVTLVDVDPDRAATAAALGVRFALPADAPGDQDLVVHASASATGLQRGLELLAVEGTLLELSWYGTKTVEVGLGGEFHARRLNIRASQVGMIAPARRGRRSFADRLQVALDLLRDNAFDALLDRGVPFASLPHVLSALADGTRTALCQVIDYPEEP